jgi:hypothetical protein
MATESGWSNQKKLGQAQHKTIQNVGSDRYGISTAQMYLHDLGAAISIINADVSPDNKLIFLEIPSHGAHQYDIVRILSSGPLKSWEYEIAEIIDPDIIAVWNTSEALVPVIGNQVKVCRWITAKSDDEGALVTTAGPLQFKKDGVTTEVAKDTAISANTIPLPVEIVAASGTEINITAGDLNIHSSHDGANPDSMQIGDGTEILAVNVDGSINVNDAAVLAKLGDIEVLDFATETTLALIEGKDFATETTLALLEGKDFATEATLASIDGKDFATETTLASLEGKDFATEATLALLEAKDFGTEATLTNIESFTGAIITPWADIDNSVPIGSNGDQVPLRVDIGGQLFVYDTWANQVLTDIDSKIAAVRDRLPGNAGSFAEILNLTTTAQTFTAPAGAKWCKVMNLGDENIRMKIGATATTSSGIRLEPGRSEDFSGVGNISVIAEQGTNQQVAVQWG